MKMKYEREQGMTSIYRKLRKECRSFTLRRHVTILILAVAMMVPAGVYAEYTAEILSEKRPGQAFEAGWADGNGNFAGQIVQFEGHGVIQAFVYDVAGVIQVEKTIHGSARLKVDTVGEEVLLEDCDPQFSSCSTVPNGLRIIDLSEGETVILELKGAFQQTNEPFVGYQRGRLTLEITVPAVP